MIYRQIKAVRVCQHTHGWGFLPTSSQTPSWARRSRAAHHRSQTIRAHIVRGAYNVFDVWARVCDANVKWCVLKRNNPHATVVVGVFQCARAQITDHSQCVRLMFVLLFIFYFARSGNKSTLMDIMNRGNIVWFYTLDILGGLRWSSLWNFGRTIWVFEEILMHNIYSVYALFIWCFSNRHLKTVAALSVPFECFVCTH